MSVSRLSAVLPSIRSTRIRPSEHQPGAAAQRIPDILDAAPPAAATPHELHGDEHA
jgi:hypothetical protein